MLAGDGTPRNAGVSRRGNDQAGVEAPRERVVRRRRHCRRGLTRGDGVETRAANWRALQGARHKRAGVSRGKASADDAQEVVFERDCQ
jgi:hypothetical protein